MNASRKRIKSVKNKNFLQKSFMHYSQKTTKISLNSVFLGIMMVSISLSDKNIKILKN